MTAPVAGGRGQGQLLGWRLWRLRPQGLRSWAARCYWKPGANRATCLSADPCPRAPGSACRCGFWGLFSPTRCLQHARLDPREQMTVLGLVQGWGEVALHGEEGFRAADAAVVALFRDWVWDAGAGPENQVQRWWRWLLHAGEGRSAPGPTPPDSDREALLSSLASTYAVPVLTLEDALRSGFLAEIGVDVGGREEVRRLLERSPSATRAARDARSGHHGVNDAT